jgi:hypothetical protein
VHNLARNNLNNLIEVKEYVKENWGSPFIVGFMFFIISAAVSLSFSLSSSADAVAVYAFYALVAGVILQLICFLKYSPNIEREAS